MSNCADIYLHISFSAALSFVVVVVAVFVWLNGKAYFSWAHRSVVVISTVAFFAFYSFRQFAGHCDSCTFYDRKTNDAWLLNGYIKYTDTGNYADIHGNSVANDIVHFYEKCDNIFLLLFHNNNKIGPYNNKVIRWTTVCRMSNLDLLMFEFRTADDENNCTKQKKYPLEAQKNFNGFMSLLEWNEIVGINEILISLSPKNG